MNDHITCRVCTKCEQSKPLTTEYFQPRKTGRDGFNSQCRECRRKAAKSYPSTKSEKKKQSKSEHSKRPDIVERRKQKRRERYANDKEYRQQIREADKNQKKKNPELTRAKKRDEYHRHKETYAINQHCRRTIERGLPSTLTKKQWLECLEYWDYKCCICGRSKEPKIKIAKDHWIAVKDDRPNNPGTVKENIVPMCHGIGGCNLSKGNRDPIKWLYSIYPSEQACKILDRVMKYFETVGSHDV